MRTLAMEVTNRVTHERKFDAEAFSGIEDSRCGLSLRSEGGRLIGALEDPPRFSSSWTSPAPIESE